MPKWLSLHAPSLYRTSLTYLLIFIQAIQQFNDDDVFFGDLVDYRSTHWEQSVLYIDQPLMVKQGDDISGKITMSPNAKYFRCISFPLKSYLLQKMQILIEIISSLDRQVSY